MGSKFDSSGLAVDWESDGLLRLRVRESGQLLVKGEKNQEWVMPTRANCNANRAVLLPVLRRLSLVEGFALPCLAPLQGEIGEFLVACGNPTESKMIWKNAVEIKKLVGFVKRKANRHEYTKERS